MKVLALYDIHGNSDALRAVLDDPRSQEADVVVVGGDAIAGPFCTEVLALLERAHDDVRWIRGNGEREVAEEIERDDAPAESELGRICKRLTLAEIGPERARELAAHPLTLELDG